MKAIIMAGGEGTRLRPLTCDCPKPMMRLMDRPVMEYAVELLKCHGITEIAATLGYLPDSITDHFQDGSDLGVSLKYRIERTPLGTAGGVYQARDLLDETFIVLSGDGVTDLDITDALRFHREKNALATLVLKTVEDPLEYGVVMTGEDGRVKGFIEKPDPSNVFSAAANTGIYILEPQIFDHIPPDTAYDFGSQLFPALISRGLPVYGYDMQGYWCDIGDVNAYIASHIHAMQGRIRLPGLNMTGITVPDSADIHPTARLESPCVIGEGAQIGENARIGAYSVIGAGSVVSKNADIKRSVIWPNASIGERAQARGCVMARGSRLENDAQAYESSVAGTGAVLGERSALLPGVKLWPGKQTAPGERVESNLIWGGSRRQGFSGGTLPMDHPGRVMRAAQAFAALFSPRTLLLGRTDDPIANVMWHAAAAGAMAQGVQVMDGGVCTLPVLRHGMEMLGCDLCALVTENSLIPLQPSGARLVSKQQRALLAMYARQDFPRPFSAGLHPVIPESQLLLSYTADTSRYFSADPGLAPEILIYSPDPFTAGSGHSVLSRAGLKTAVAKDMKHFIPSPHGLGLRLDPLGERISLSDREGPLTEAEHQLFFAWTALQSGVRRLILPVSASRSVQALAQSCDAAVEYIGGEPLMWQNTLAEKHPQQFRLYHDGTAAVLQGISILTANKLTLGHWRSMMPRICRQKRRVSTPAASAGRILGAFTRDIPEPRLDCGIHFSRNGAWAWVCPDENRSSFQIITESASAETALELCDFCENKIRKLLEK